MSLRRCHFTALVAADLFVITGNISCTVDPTAAMALDGKYNLVVTGAEPGSILPTGTQGDVVISGGLPTTFLSQPVTDAQLVTSDGNHFVWKGTMEVTLLNPPITSGFTLDVQDHGGGILVGDTFFTNANISSAVSEVTLTKGAQPSF